MKKIQLFLICILFGFCNVQSQIYEPVKWQFEKYRGSESTEELNLKAVIDAGWYIYDIYLTEKGPIPTSFTFEKVEGAELIGKITPNKQPLSKRSEIFNNAELRFYEHFVTFKQIVKVTDRKKFLVSGYVTYMSCNDEMCLPPTDVEFEFKSAENEATESENKVEPVASKSQPVTVSPNMDILTIYSDSSSMGEVISEEPISKTDYWKPVIEELKSFGNESPSSSHLGWYVFIGGFIGGLLALLTPCVWPMIPMTVSFFIKKDRSRKKSIKDALLYAFSIIVIYLGLGLVITGIFGASALNQLSTNAFFNLLFFALLVVFAISFFGVFEINLPSSWTTKLDKKADSSTGLLSIFLMAFTLVLVSFSCTGPIIGTLLVQAASYGDVSGPALGMFGFALALAIPFALFALFPSLMQNTPKSGGWLNVVKVVLGFLELALALKFLSVADLAYHWGILDREVFLVLWIIIFTLLGIYLLGKIRFPNDTETKHLSVFRFFMAIISFSFALYMFPGLFGAPLKAISAFSPPLYTQDFNLYKEEVLPKYTDYEDGMEYAKKQEKPVLLDFTGYGCVNCRNMEVAVWTDPRVKDIIDHDFVLISLYVDDKKYLPEKIEVQEFGKKRVLKTVGDKWSYLQRYKFGTNAQPFYVLLDNNGNPIAPSYTYDKNIEKYIDFLKNGLKKYKDQLQ